LVRILHNAHLSRAQREGRQPGLIDERHLESTPAPEEAAASPFAYSLEGMDQQLKRALAALAPEYQVVLMLWAVDELSYKEIAETVGIPIGTVMSRLYRARQQLSDQLREFALREGMIRE
jgi:RNA polymerase sigma-70 factor (ECF subfamily)